MGAYVQTTSISENINTTNTSTSNWAMSLNPISDLKPTLNDSQVEYLNNQTKNLYGSNMSESQYGDSLTGSNKSSSNSGDSAINSNIYRTNNNSLYIGEGATVTDGGAIGAMYELTKTMLQSQLKTVQEKVTEEKAETEAAKTAADIKKIVSDFYDKHKAAVILAGVAAGWLIYRSVK